MSEGSWIERTFYPENDPISNSIRGTTEKERQARMDAVAAATSAEGQARKTADQAAAARLQEEEVGKQKRTAAFLRDYPSSKGFGSNPNTARGFLLGY